MFKKLKDKLAEEVKSSPQRIQQFAQAAQAAVTSASSSISDITNTDLFSIGDNESQQSRSMKSDLSTSSQQSTFQDVSLVLPASFQTDSTPSEYTSAHDRVEYQPQRRLSNSSFASDISFRLPSYESPSMYHLQSDMEISASEAEERGFSGSAVSLERVTKEQIYAAYKRTQDRYTKYRTQYADLARHYKLLERENAKARSVLVETQDKALRRISELREQCALEQSAKAHLEKALRVEIEEKILKIDTLNTKIKFLQDGAENNDNTVIENDNQSKENQLITFSSDNDKQTNDEKSSEMFALTNKIEKLEQLLMKYKESLKQAKEKNGQLTAEVQCIINEHENKIKENEQLKRTAALFIEAEQKIKELNESNEELQNKINSYDFTKTKEASTLESDLQKAQEDIEQLHRRIEVYTKREEEYAISLAENKLSIHKELESKENEIKSLKDSLSDSKKEIQSLNIVLDDYKSTIQTLEDERSKLNKDINELNVTKTKLTELESEIQILTQKCQTLENVKAKSEEEFKCFQLQLKQETAEKLAMIDRNSYLENRNTLLSDENIKKSSKISSLDEELCMLKKSKEITDSEETNKNEMLDEIKLWKNKFNTLEHEIQEERDELVKLQTEIEKLLANHELIQIQNKELQSMVKRLNAEKTALESNIVNNHNIKSSCDQLLQKIKNLKELFMSLSQDTKLLKKSNDDDISTLKENIFDIINKFGDVKINLEALQNDQVTSLDEIKKVKEELFESSNALSAVEKERNELIILTKRQENEVNEICAKYTMENETLQNENKEIKDSNTKLLIEIDSIRTECSLLKDVINSKELEKEQTNAKCSDEVELLQKEIYELKSRLESKEANGALIHEQIVSEIDTMRKESNTMKHTINLKEKESEEIVVKYTAELNSLKKEIEELKSVINSRELKIAEINDKSGSEISILKDENYNLKSIVELKTSENAQIKEQVESINCQYDENLIELESMKEDKKILIEKLAKLENLHQSLQESLQNESHDKKSYVEKLSTLQLENETVLESIHKAESQNFLLQQEVEKLSRDRDQNINEINELRRNKEHLAQEIEDIDFNKRALIEKLENTIKTLTEENIALQFQSDKIACSAKDLEIEISEVRKSHTEIELEKDRLNSILERLENSEREYNLIASNIESARNKGNSNDGVSNNIENHSNVPQGEAGIIKQDFQQLGLILSNDEDKKETKLGELSHELTMLKDENTLQKQENKRLQSDIAGLQSYLTKISKENSILNDKLRELLASSENTPDKVEVMTIALTDLNNEIQIGRQKIDDLLRENMLLVDENFELKDQLNSHTYKPITSEQVHNTIEKESVSLNEKYSTLLEEKSKLEKKLYDLEHSNDSINSNMLRVQQNNEKLRLSNEKLERRLDEALVSLRHLHSLQENTELEYLRNILYEYFTGSGTHSITLAKVLSAVVKFDDAQTQHVLQKEKERQGFLRQLGLL